MDFIEHLLKANFELSTYVNVLKAQYALNELADFVQLTECPYIMRVFTEFKFI